MKASDVLLALIVVGMPVSIQYTNIFVGLLLVTWVISFDREFLVGQMRNNGVALIAMLAPFVMTVVTLTYTSSFDLGIHSIEKYLSLLFFPLIICTIRLLRPVDFFLNVFAGVVLLMCVICFSAGVYRFYFVDPATLPMVGDFFTGVPTRWNALTNTNLVRPFQISPIYFSMYISFAVFILAFRTNAGIVQRVIAIVFLLFFQILLGSRIGLLAQGVAGFASIFFVPSGKAKRYLLIVTGACFFAVLVAIAVNPILRKRYTSDLVALQIPERVSGWNAINLRKAIWTCSAEQFMRAPVLGQGVGGQSASREICYQRYSFYGIFGTDFNSHNQYIEYALIGGTVLLLLFLFQLGYSFLHSLRAGSVIHSVFLLTVIITAFGESILEAHKGIVFFSCFNSLFLFKQSQSSQNV